MLRSSPSFSANPTSLNLLPLSVPPTRCRRSFFCPGTLGLVCAFLVWGSPVLALQRPCPHPLPLSCVRASSPPLPRGVVSSTWSATLRSSPGLVALASYMFLWGHCRAPPFPPVPSSSPDLSSPPITPTVMACTWSLLLLMWKSRNATPRGRAQGAAVFLSLEAFGILESYFDSDFFFSSNTPPSHTLRSL